jgi:hypothetical protein
MATSNTVYIPAGLSVKTSTGAAASNTAYIPAGLIPEKEQVAAGGALPSRVLTGPFEGSLSGPV